MTIRVFSNVGGDDPIFNLEQVMLYVGNAVAETGAIQYGPHDIPTQYFALGPTAPIVIGGTHHYTGPQIAFLGSFDFGGPLGVPVSGTISEIRFSLSAAPVGAPAANYYTSFSGLSWDVTLGLDDLAARLTGEPWYYQGSAASDYVRATDFADELYGGPGHDELWGGLNADRLYGGQGRDTLYGERGFDLLYGGRGNDVLFGGMGRDLLNGGEGLDAAAYFGSPTGVTVDLRTPDLNTGEAAGDTFISIERVYGTAFADDLRGDAQDNSVHGNGGDDVIYGRAGNDFLWGAAGNDTLVGGLGNDEFAYDEGLDVIADFDQAGNDDILLSVYWVAPNVATFADVLTLATQVGNDTVIDFGGGNTLTLSNVILGSLQAEDFVI